MAGSVEVTKEDILKLWFEWVEKNASWRERCGVMSCHFCDGEFIIAKSVINHKNECVYRLTDEYIFPLSERE